MATTNRTRRHTPSQKVSPSVESVIATVRSLWQHIDDTPQSDQHKLKKDISDTVKRLKGRILAKLGKPKVVPINERHLFDEIIDSSKTDLLSELELRFPEPKLRVYAKDFADHVLQHLPQSSKYNSADEFRTYLSEKLRFNSQSTRRRTANYIVSRFFPNDYYNQDLPPFCAATTGTPALGEALFYLTCRVEKIVSLVAEEIVYPSLAQGVLTRNRIREYVQGKFPSSRSVDDIGQAVVRTYQLYGLGNATRTCLNVSVREGTLVSFAYVLFLEFPEPGMHAFEKMLDGPMHRWMLWDRQWMVRQLYRLREAGLLSKVSEIDRLRQFTTKYTLAEAANRIVALAKESSI